MDLFALSGSLSEADTKTVVEAHWMKPIASLLTSTCFHTTIFAYSEKESSERVMLSESEASLP